MMKRTVLVILSIAVLLLLSACGGSSRAEIDTYMIDPPARELPAETQEPEQPAVPSQSETVDADTQQEAPAEPEPQSIEAEAPAIQEPSPEPDKPKDPEPPKTPQVPAVKEEQPSKEERPAPDAKPPAERTPPADAEPEPVNEPPAEPLAQDPAPEEPSARETSSQSAPTAGGGSGNGDNFNTYDAPEQQQTEDTFVLNTKSEKIHHPWCSSVKKILPENYSTSSKSVEELESQGYTRCGQKGDWN